MESVDELEASGPSNATSTKRVSRRKLVKRPKVRGPYKPKPKPDLANGDPDLAECLFSDEDVCFPLSRKFI